MKITTTKDLYNKDQTHIPNAKWNSVTISRQQFITHVTSGYAWAIGEYTDNRRTADNFLSSSVLALDIDGVEGTVTTLDDLMANAFLASFCGFIYASPSYTPQHPKWRVVFFLDASIDNAEEYKSLMVNLIAMMSKSIVGIDAVAKDSARFFFGHDLQARPELVWQSDNTLPLSVARDIEGAVEAVTRMSYKSSLGRRAVAVADAPITPTKAMVAKVGKKFMARISALETVSVNRNHTCFKLCADMNDSGVAVDVAYPLVYSAMVKNGYIAEDGVYSFKATFTSAFGKTPDHSDVLWMNEADEDAPFLKLAHYDRLLTLNTRYVTDMADVDFERMMSYPVVLIKSPTGSGKSSMMTQICDKFEQMHGKTPRVLVICHRKALVNRTATDLGIPTHATDDFKGSAVVTIDSLFKYQTTGGTIDHDIIILDEATQSLLHMVKSPFLRRSRNTPQTMLTNFIQHAKLVVCMDANFSHESALWIERTSLRPVLRVFNAGKPPARATTVWDTKYGMLTDAFLSALDGFTAIACCQKSDAHVIARIAETFGIKVLCVTSETADNAELEAVLFDINHADIQLLIYTSSLGTGVDITRACKNAYLIATQTLTGEDCVQMISRVRNAEKYHVVGIAQSKDDHSIMVTQEQILEDLQWCAFYDTEIVSEESKASAKLYAELKVSENYQRKNQSKSFCRSALQNGFCFVERLADDNDFVRAVFRVASEADEIWQCETTLNHAPITAEQQKVILEAKTNTREITYGRKRNIIENFVGETILEIHYDELHTVTKYERMANLAYVQLEAFERVELNTRKNVGVARQDYNPILLRTQFFAELMVAMGLSELEDLYAIVGYSKETLVTDTVKTFIDGNRVRVRWLFGRTKFTEDHITELQFLLLQYSVPLKRKSKVMKGTRVRSGNGEQSRGTRASFMTIDAVALAQRLGIAEKIIEKIRLDNSIREGKNK